MCIQDLKLDRILPTMTIHFGLKFNNQIPEQAFFETRSGKKVNVRQSIDEMVAPMQLMLPDDDLTLTMSGEYEEKVRMDAR